MPSQGDMRIMTWNARGLNAPNRKKLLKHNLNSFESDIVLIQETKLNKLEEVKLDKILGVWSSLFQEFLGSSEGLGILWDPKKVCIKILNISNN